jgi:hypothetical protein
LLYTPGWKTQKQRPVKFLTSDKCQVPPPLVQICVHLTIDTLVELSQKLANSLKKQKKKKIRKEKKKVQFLVQISSVKLLNVSSNNAQQLESRLVVVVSSQEP